MHRPQTNEQFNEILTGTKNGPIVIGFFGNFSQIAQKAKPSFEEFAKNQEGVEVVFVDVQRLKGIHKAYAVTEVPTVVLVEKNRVTRKVVGPASASIYERTLFPVGHAFQDGDEDKPAHSVVLYVGAHCPWCSRARNYLRKQRIRFHEIDVSKNPSDAESLVSRSGQRGVPQINIDGHWVTGFDQTKIDRLLGIQ